MSTFKRAIPRLFIILATAGAPLFFSCSTTSETVEILDWCFLGDQYHFATLENYRKVKSSGSVISPSSEVLKESYSVYVHHAKTKEKKAIYSTSGVVYQIFSNLADTTVTVCANSSQYLIYKYTGERVDSVRGLPFEVEGWVKPYTDVAVADYGTHTISIWNLQNRTSSFIDTGNYANAQQWGIVYNTRLVFKHYHDGQYDTMQVPDIYNYKWINDSEIVGFDRLVPKPNLLIKYDIYHHIVDTLLDESQSFPASLIINSDATIAIDIRETKIEIFNLNTDR
jgi:hypothetical protein